MKHFAYFFKRIFLIPPTLLGITLICFALSQFIPGGPVEQALLNMRGIESSGSGTASARINTVTEKQKKELTEYFGFDKPLLTRYFSWLGNIMNLDFGYSYKYPNKKVLELIKSRLPVSLIFGLTGFILQYLICIPLGIFKAIKHNTKFDMLTSIVIFIGYSIPAFAFGMVLKLIFCGVTDNLFDIFPLTGFISENFYSLDFFGKFKDIILHMTLPVLCYVIGSFAVLTLLMKNSLIENITNDYMRTSVAYGNSFYSSVFKRALKNSLIPIATGFGGFLSIILAGSVLIEKIFEIPGMGLLSLDAIVSRDYNVFMAIIFIQSFLGLLGNVISDFCYVLIDPRISFEKL